MYKRLVKKAGLLGILLACGWLSCASAAPGQVSFHDPLITASATENLGPAQDHFVYLPMMARQCLCYYVDSVNGSDSNPGTSSDKPWRTLAPVNAARFLPGSRVNFKRGSSWTGDLEIDDSGTQGNPIVFTAYGAGERPVFKNPGVTKPWHSTITIVANWVIVEGLLITDTLGVGLGINGNSSNNIIRDVEIAGVGWGVKGSGQHNLYTRNYIHDLKMMINTPGGGYDDVGAVGFGVFDSYSEYSYNRLVNCIAPSYDWGKEGGGFEIFGQLDGDYIHHNWVESAGGFMELGGSPGDSIQNTTVAYNVFVNEKWFFYTNLSGEYGAGISNLRIENNTIVMNTQGWAVFHFGQGTLPPIDAIHIRNNIVYLTTPGGIVADEPNFVHTNNIYFLGEGNTLGDNNNWTPAQLDPTEKIIDPLFVNLPGKDLHLQTNSPAINAGVNLGYTLDFDNHPVPVGPTPDEGAFEYSGADAGLQSDKHHDTYYGSGRRPQ